MTEGHDLYTLDDATAEQVTGTRPVLLHALDGFVDAGGAGRVAVDHLLAHFAPTRLVTFEVDELADYRSRRPTMVFDSTAWVAYDAPHLVIDLLHDAEGTPFLVMHGVEPDLRWERFTADVIGIVERFQVPVAIGLHGIPMGVPHTRPIGATVHGTVPDAEPAWFASVTVPAGVGALLEYRLAEQGHDAMGVAVHVPHYLAGSAYPQAAMLALERVQRATGLSLRVEALESASADASAEIERQVVGDADVADVVRALEEQYDTVVSLGSVGLRGSLDRPPTADDLPAAEDLPTADELGAQVERFLAQQSPPESG